MLGTVLLIWLTSTATSSRAPLGSRGSLALVAVAAAVVAAATVLIYVGPRLASAARWSVAMLVALVNVGVGCLALVTVLDPGESSDVGIGLLLGIAVAATNVVAGRLARSPATGTPDTAS